jgi:hypothetical protein
MSMSNSRKAAEQALKKLKEDGHDYESYTVWISLETKESWFQKIFKKIKGWFL